MRRGSVKVIGDEKTVTYRISPRDTPSVTSVTRVRVGWKDRFYKRLALFPIPQIRLSVIITVNRGIFSF